MCFVWLSKQTVHFALYIINRLVIITEVESVYSAVLTEDLYNTDAFHLNRVSVARSTMLLVGPCHHGMARPRVADGGTASNIEGSCKYIEKADVESRQWVVL
jgi:hypothetical protein